MVKSLVQQALDAADKAAHYPKNRSYIQYGLRPSSGLPALQGKSRHTSGGEDAYNLLETVMHGPPSLPPCIGRPTTAYSSLPSSKAPSHRSSRKRLPSLRPLRPSTAKALAAKAASEPAAVLDGVVLLPEASVSEPQAAAPIQTEDGIKILQVDGPKRDRKRSSMCYQMPATKGTSEKSPQAPTATKARTQSIKKKASQTESAKRKDTRKSFDAPAALEGDDTEIDDVSSDSVSEGTLEEPPPTSGGVKEKKVAISVSVLAAGDSSDESDKDIMHGSEGSRGGDEGADFMRSKQVKQSLDRRRHTLKNKLVDRIGRVKQAGSKSRSIRRQQMEDLQRLEFAALAEDEAQALLCCFERYDLDCSDTLEGNEIVEALRELGLRGASQDEKREILRIVRECCTEAAGGIKAVGSGRRKLARQGPVSVDFLTFALKVVPRIRQRLGDLHASGTAIQFCLLDQTGSGRLAVSQCLEICRGMGLDQRFMAEQFQACENPDDGVTVEEFQAAAIRGREQLERVVKARERAIQLEMELEEQVFVECRADIVLLYDVFMRYKTHRGSVPRESVVSVMREFGLHPKSMPERHELHAILELELQPDENDSYRFTDLLQVLQRVRALRVESNEHHQKTRFEWFDKDKNGYLNMVEISMLLADVGCSPHNRKEQIEIAELIQGVDEDGNGEIDFREFQVLSQRISERLKSMRFEEDIAFALELGFTETQLRDLREVFDSIDEDGSEKLSASEVRMGLARMNNKKVSAHAFDAAFNVLDTDGSGELDFSEFLGFMQLMRDGEGIFGEDGVKLAARVRGLESSLLRRVLECFRLSKHYLTSLMPNDLVELFCECFEVDPHTNIALDMGITTAGELFKVAKQRGAAQADAAIQ
eukprot:TRINITY_DN11450_c0_g1_i6.p1 TRINITY_DN11450_c0_g1~~TRINITY_DN11450_c0_g1_i6.p1  ORF type:complete len:877 (-),score=255.27 TRINITY_DN11450_c0_g1_i6:603-3233(-)